MEVIEINTEKYLQEEKNSALVAALKTGNDILIELVLKLKPDVVAGGEMLFKYAIANNNIDLLGELLSKTEIRKNKELLDEGIRIAASSNRNDWIKVLIRLFEEGGNKDVAVATLLQEDSECEEEIMTLVKLGANAFFVPMQIEKHQNVAEAIFEAGYGNSIEFSTCGLEMFFANICKNNRQGVIKRLIQDRLDLAEKLVKFVVSEGYVKIVRLIHKEKVFQNIDEASFEKAISGKHYLVVKYLVECGCWNVTKADIVYAARFGNVKILRFLIEKDVQQLKSQGIEINFMRYSIAIEIAAYFDRCDIVMTFLEDGFKCDFDKAIKGSSSQGYLKMVNMLMEYATTFNNDTFNESIDNAYKKGATRTANIMKNYRKKHPQKFQ